MHRWKGASGIEIAGDTWGDPTGTPVVLLHGGGQTRHAWGGTGAFLGRAGYFAVVFDARGHGDSEWAHDGNYGQDAMVRDLQCVLAALGIEQPVLVGASMGGGTSLVAVGEDHVEARALILVDVVPRIEADGVAKITAFMKQKPDGFDSLEEVAEAIRSYQPHRRRAPRLEGLAKNVRLGQDGRYHWHWDPRFVARPRDLHRRQERLSACARRVNIPTLLVRGGTSDVVTEAGVRDFLGLCPHAEYVNIAQAGHMVAGDRNDVFGRAAMEFLARTVPGRTSLPHPPDRVTWASEYGDDEITDVP